ncbi:hypothetical protein O181_024309 [Austropuccinia psidii MF-1]|uniref:Retrovirus-related Pol polyprotein from transposon TNT 1-94-like beta-barrel domain-containing protein n=1 Tax=Austropuccinia psidii MF-1 TaxID=1389203 RepID=A0A9Q3CIF1_9BASI|nr:hypothetical protein [Austropuccinia psidii MF-1]
MAKAAKSDREKFVLDSGATKTMVKNLEYFQQINMRKDSIKLADGLIVYSLGQGTIVLDLPNVSLKLKESLYIPDLAANLISMSTFRKSNHMVEAYNQEKLEVIDQNKTRILIGSFE